MREASGGSKGKPTCVFFDTTEFAVKDAFPRLGPVMGHELSGAAQAIGARLLVTDLTIDETANIWLREFQQAYKVADSKIRPYVTVGEAPEPGALRTRFKEDILSAARKVPLTVAHSKKKDLGFSDALVFLKSLQYAKEQSIGEYWLVSADMGLDEHALRSVAKRHAVECRLLRSTVEAIDLMKSLRAIDRSSLDSDLPKAALALLQANTEAIRQFLQDHPIDVSQAWGIVLDRMVGAGYVTVMPFPMPGSLSGISMKAVHVDTAVPESIPEDGSVAPIAFRGHAQAEVAVQRQGPPVAARPSPYYGTFLFGPSGMHHFSGTLAVEIVDVPISGRAHAVFRGGAFVAPLTVESVSVATGPGG